MKYATTAPQCVSGGNASWCGQRRVFSLSGAEDIPLTVRQFKILRPTPRGTAWQKKKCPGPILPRRLSTRTKSGGFLGPCIFIKKQVIGYPRCTARGGLWRGFCLLWAFCAVCTGMKRSRIGYLDDLLPALLGGGAGWRDRNDVTTDIS